MLLLPLLPQPTVLLLPRCCRRARQNAQQPVCRMPRCGPAASGSGSSQRHCRRSTWQHGKAGALESRRLDGRDAWSCATPLRQPYRPDYPWFSPCLSTSNIWTLCSHPASTSPGVPTIPLEKHAMDPLPTTKPLCHQCSCVVGFGLRGSSAPRAGQAADGIAVQPLASDAQATVQLIQL